MRRLIGVRNVLATVSVLALLTAASGAMAQASDPLVQLLVKKGVLSSSDVAGVTTRDQLTNLLVRKGVISARDAAALPPSPPVVVAAPAPAPAAVGVASAPSAVAPAPPLIAQTPGGSPFAFRVGGVNFRVGGFIDFETIIRSSNAGEGAGTNFGSVPFSNTVAGHMNDLRLTAQNTRLNLKATSNFLGNDVTGYVEMDFNGNDASSAVANTNSHTPRLRLAYMDVMRGPFELQAGQLWSWATPNRNGLSADPNDVFTTYNYDANYIAGLTWARQAAIRAVYHPTPNVALGISVENPDQFTGGEVTFPAAFNAQLAGQADNGAQLTVPNVAPDVIPKVAFDGDPLGMHLHAEALGLFRAFRITTLPDAFGASFGNHTTITAAGGANANLEVLPGLTFVAGGMYGPGIGRYVGGLGPDFVAKTVAVPGGFDANISPVVGASGVVGAEWHITPDNLVALYGGAAFFHRNFVFDPTNPNNSAFFTANVGFGGPNSANSNSRVVKEISADYAHTFWQDPQYGAVQAGAQFAVVVREPWFVAAGAPKDAIAKLGFIDLRYILP